MSDDKNYPGWFAWLWDQGIWAFTGSLFVACLLLLGGVYYLDQRLGRIEDNLAYEEHGQYEAEDLARLAAQAQEASALPIRRLTYVPIYSHVYYGGGHPYLLEATLSIRNVDPDDPIFVKSVRYFDTRGELAKTYVDQTIRLAPLETIELLVPEKDATGGSGANFLVDWRTADEVEPPLIEAVMVGVERAQGISFSSRGRTLKQQPE